MLVSLKDIVGCEDYYIDDSTFQIVSFKNKKYEQGRILKPDINGSGYIRYNFSVNNKVKHILLHHIIIKLFIDKNFDSTKFEVDHKDRNKTNNNIDNLCIVSHLENQRNRSSMNGKEFNFVDNIGRSLTINEEAQIYYSLELDKFFMYIKHTNKYNELHECIYNGYPSVSYCYNNKVYKFRTTKFRKNLKKQ